MANNKQRSGGKNTGLKVFASIVSVLLAASVITTGVCFGTGVWQVTPDEPAQEENYDGSIIEETTSDGVSLMSTKIATADYAEYGISPLAETAYTLTATVFDEDGSSSGIPQNVTYTAEWKNPSSEWANGKDVNDYYQVTSTGINTATATCLQAFGEPVTITATSYFNPEAYCTWEANYVKRVENITATIQTIAQLSGLALDSEYGFSDIQVTYGTGTVTGEVSFTSYSWNWASGFATKLTTDNTYYSYFLSLAEAAGIDVDFDLEYNMYNTAKLTNLIEDKDDYLGLIPREMFKSNMPAEDVTKLEDATEGLEYFFNAIHYAATKQNNDIRAYIEYSYTYNEQEFSSGNFYTGWCEVVGTYPQPSSVTGNDVTLVH